MYKEIELDALKKLDNIIKDNNKISINKHSK